MQTIANLLQEFWRQMVSVLSDLGDWIITVFDPNSGPWPKIAVGGTFFLIVLFIVAKTSKAK